MFRRLGYFVTESSEHFSEYVPWFIKRDRPDLLETYNIPLDEYITRCEFQISTWEAMRNRFEADDIEFRVAGNGAAEEHVPMDGSVREIDRIVNNMLTLKRSLEYGSQIIYGMETGEPQVIYGNVMNDGLIDNLPQDCCVEVPCLVDKNGVQPVHVGALPVHLAALMQTNINVQRLTVEAALTGRREHVYHAAMLDPHTAAELDLEQTWSLVDDMIEAHGDMLPAYE